MSDESPLDRMLALAVIPELADLPPDALASVAARTEEHFWVPGRSISGEEPCATSFLLTGRLEVGAHGEPVEAPALVGAVETLAGVPLPLRAIGEGAHGLTVERDALVWLMNDVFEVWLAMMRHTAARWRAAEPVAAEPRVAASARWKRSDAESGISIASRIALLGACEIFRGWRVHALGRVALEMEELELPATAVLWEPGSRASHCIAVVDGALESAAVAASRAPIQHGPGAVVGLREVLAAGDRASGLATSGGARVLRLAGEALIDELEDDPETAGVFLDGLAHRTLQAEGASRSREPR